MKKIALIFILGVFLPALLLGLLALQSARQQGILIQDQEVKLRQQEVNNLATQLNLTLQIEHEQFIAALQQLVKQNEPRVIAANFNQKLAESWQRKGVAFAVTRSGQILSPNEEEPNFLKEGLEFIEENSAFLKGRVKADVYLSAKETLATVRGELQQSRTQKAISEPPLAVAKSAAREKVLLDAAAQTAEANPSSGITSADSGNDLPSPNSEATAYSSLRNVAPQYLAQNKDSEPLKLSSSLNRESSLFSELVSKGKSGIISRFVNDRLEILFWFRPDLDPEIVFGVRILPSEFQSVLAQVLTQEGLDHERIGAAILDDRAKPFLVSTPTLTADWKSPFVATEIGEILPHWEVGLYLKDANQLNRTARVTSLSIMGLIALALGSIAVGGSLVVADTRRQINLVKKKTDFVSNVSHELKTPLTSIRMFSELLQNSPNMEKNKVSSYLQIITVEAERLTRLINNVLDFSALERGQKKMRLEKIDFYEILNTVWQIQELSLKQHHFKTKWTASGFPYVLMGDSDALAQVIINLISNAEKYSGEIKDIELLSNVSDGYVIVSVCDRGLGIPIGEEKKIFEPFYRAHDSLSSGIQGSGLGLTLALKIVQEHGGQLVHQKRKNGGIRFTMSLPLLRATS